MKFARTDLREGDRVVADSGVFREGTFLGYGPANAACPDTHISYPGMRLVRVQLDTYRDQSWFWEMDVRSAS